MGLAPPLTSKTHCPTALQPVGTSVGQFWEASQGGEQKSPVRPVTVTFISSDMHPVVGSP